MLPFSCHFRFDTADFRLSFAAMLLSSFAAMLRHFADCRFRRRCLRCRFSPLRCRADAMIDDIFAFAIIFAAFRRHCWLSMPLRHITIATLFRHVARYLLRFRCFLIAIVDFHALIFLTMML